MLAGEGEEEASLCSLGGWTSQRDLVHSDPIALLLRNGLYVMLVGDRYYGTERIAAYVIPGIEESPTGWAGAGGGSARKGAAR